MKSSGTSYLLAVLGLFTPFAGMHRFYLGKPLSGFLFLITWGFFGIGTILDLVNMRLLVDYENRRQLPGELHRLALEAPREKLSPEQQILRVARENGGAVTIAMVAVQTGMSLRQTKKELERLRTQEFCTVDITGEGSKLYVFGDLRGNKPLELE